MIINTGRDLKVWLVKNGLKQADLATLLGVTNKTVNKYCNADRLPKMVKLAICGLSIFTTNEGDQ